MIRTGRVSAFLDTLPLRKMKMMRQTILLLLVITLFAVSIVVCSCDQNTSIDTNLEENDKVNECDLKNLRVVKRGTDPQDYKWFSYKAIETLKKAQQEVEWLLGRDYNSKSVIDFVGNFYQFSTRQRNALHPTFK